MNEKQTPEGILGTNSEIIRTYLWVIGGSPSSKEFIAAKPAHGPIQINPNYKFAFDEYSRQYSRELLEALRTSFSEYVKSEGCSCCSDNEKHEESAEKIGELLGFQKYGDGSGYDFYTIQKHKENKTNNL